MPKQIKKSDWPVGEKITVLDTDGIFPESCIEVAGVYIPVRCIGVGAKICRDKGMLAFVRWQAGQMENIAHNTLKQNPNDHRLVADTKEVLSIVVSLRDAIDRGDIGEACCDAIGLGRFAERLRIRLHGFDGYVRQVKTTTRKLRIAAAEFTHSPEIIAQAVRDWNKLHKANPTRKLGLIDKELANKFRVSDRTIREWRKKTS